MRKEGKTFIKYAVRETVHGWMVVKVFTNKTWGVSSHGSKEKAEAEAARQNELSGE